jgi:hypothetical protein
VATCSTLWAHEVTEFLPARDGNFDPGRCLSHVGTEGYEGRSSRAAARGCWLEAVLPQDALDRVAADPMAEVVQRTDQSRVTPRRVLRRHPDDQPLHVVAGDWATRSPAS